MLQITKGRSTGKDISHLPNILPDLYEFGDSVQEVLDLLVDSVNTTQKYVEGFEYTAYLSYHEYDLNKERPTLVVQGDTSSVGYAVDIKTGEVEVVCLCAATNDNECICEYQYENN